MVKFFEGLLLFPSKTALAIGRSALSYCARAQPIGLGSVDEMLGDLAEGL